MTASHCGKMNRTVAHRIAAETGSNSVAISFMPFNRCTQVIIFSTSDKC
jgi:hypothetical protein